MTGVDERVERAKEALEWLVNNEYGMFNVRCQRCNVPFEHSGQAVAAPAEWFGVLIAQKQLAEDVLALAVSVASAEQRADDAKKALRRLVVLKDGPRDEDYRLEKHRAWSAARTALAAAAVVSAEPTEETA